jgi:inosose dehydratase
MTSKSRSERMKLAYHTNAWGGVVGHPAGVTSVKDLHYLTPGSTEEAMREIAAAGYTGFELFDGNLAEYADRETELRGLMDELELELVGVYSGANFIFPEILPEELNKIRRAAELAARFGATHFVLGGGAVRAEGTKEEDYRLLAEGLDRAAEVAEALELTPSFHPHLGTCAQTPEQIARVFEQTAIGFCPDTAHLDAAGGESAALIRAYGDRIPYVHLKDYADGAFLPLGAGQLDWDGIFASLREIGYDGWIAVEADGYAGPQGEAARQSRAFLEGRL